MNEFNPLSFIVGLVAGAFCMAVLMMVIAAHVNRKYSDKPPKPQDWSRHAR